MNYIFSLSWPLLWLKNIQNCLGKFLWLVDEGSFLRMKGYNKISVFLKMSLPFSSIFSMHAYWSLNSSQNLNTRIYRHCFQAICRSIHLKSIWVKRINNDLRYFNKLYFCLHMLSYWLCYAAINGQWPVPKHHANFSWQATYIQYSIPEALRLAALNSYSYVVDGFLE